MDKEVLRQYLVLVNEIRCLKEEIKRLRESYLSPRILDGMPGTKSHGDRIASLTAKIIDLDELLTDKQIQLIDYRFIIEDAIVTLESADRLLIRLRYIEGRSWDDVAGKMGYTTRRIWQMHNNTLKKLKV